jgi:hypothetical protein
MKFFGQTLAGLFSLALLGVLGAGAYFALTFILNHLQSMDQVVAVTATASTVMLLAALIIASSIRQATTQNKANQLYAEKVMTYQRFMDVWEDLFRHGHHAVDRNPQELSEELLMLDRHLILYGAPGIVKAYAVLRVLERDNGAQHADVRSQFVKVLVEIRRDLGSGTHTLTVGELQQLCFANSDGVSASTTASAYQDLQPRVSLASNS